MYSSEKLKKYPAADGIRGLAIAIVLIGHGCGFFIPQSIPYLAGTGKIGVWLFFVLSSFLLTNKFISNGFSGSELLKYFVGRTLRILPISFIAVISYFIVGYLPAKDLTSILTMQSGYDHLWTIPVEYKFYFLLPIIAYTSILLLNKLNIYISLFFILALMLLVLSIFKPENLTPNSIQTSWYIPCFLFGIVISFIVSTCDFHAISGKINSIIVLTLTLMIILLVPVFSELMLGFVLVDNLPIRYVTISAIWAAIILFSVSKESFVNSLFCNRPLRLLGKYSFSIYLFHVLIMKSISHISRESYMLFIISIIISCCVGVLIFNFVESPIERFRHKILK